MIDWYYHDPGVGRVGPLSAGELRKRFEERRIQPDTLVWHQGLREWASLERMASEIGIARVQQDASQPSRSPPPLPSTGTADAFLDHASQNSAIPPRTTPRGKYTRTPVQRQNKRTLSTGAIVLIVVALVGIPALMIMGSMLLPAYRDYARQVTSLGAIEGVSNGLKRAVADYALRTGRCPANEDPRLIQARSEVRRRFSLDVSFASIQGGCAFEVGINADGKSIDGKMLRYEGHQEAGGNFAWDCSGGDMPDTYRPYECRRGG